MSFGSWLSSRSTPAPEDKSPAIMLHELRTEADKRAVAVRTALRGFNGLREIEGAPWSLSDKLGLPIKLHALRVVFIAWCQTLYEGVRPEALGEASDALRPLLAELDEALPEFYSRNVMGSDYAVGAWQADIEAARRVAALVETVNILEFRLAPFDQQRSYTDILDTLSLYGPDATANQAAWRAAQRMAIRRDWEALRSGSTSRRKLMLEPL